MKKADDVSFWHDWGDDIRSRERRLGNLAVHVVAVQDVRDDERRLSPDTLKLDNPRIQLLGVFTADLAYFLGPLRVVVKVEILSDPEPLVET